MPEAFGFKAWVSTDDDEALQEYKVEMDLGQKEVRCWIPSQAGTRFKVVWVNQAHLTKCVSGDLYLDGAWVGGHNKRKGDMAPVIEDSTITSPTTARHFVFLPLTLTDDDSLLGSSSAQDIGTMVLKICEVELVRNSLEPHPIRQAADGQRIVHERSKKGLVHSVGFGSEVKIPVQNIRDVHVIRTLATFVFQYRPIDFLQASDIAPRDRPPPTKHEATLEPGYKRKPEEVIDIDSDDDDDDIKRLRARLRALEDKRKKGKRIKTESRTALVPGEVLDLT